MPAPGDNPYFLLLEKNYFLALSWMIAELGKLKDNGLRILVIVEALEQTEKLTKEEATAKALNLLNYDNNMPDKILADASAVCKTFFAENNLDKLIYGITSK
jgi:hypothetical protein